MDVRDEIDMNKLQNPPKSKKKTKMPKEKKETTGRSSEEQKIGNAKQPDMKETGKYEIEKEIEAEKQIDTFQEQPQRLILKFKRRPTKSQPEVQKVLSEGDGKACTTSETEVQKPLSEGDKKSSSKSQPEVQKTSRGNNLLKQLLAKSIKQNNKKKAAQMVAAAAAAAMASKEADERIDIAAVAAQIEAEKMAPAADAEDKRV
ncbi:uncharacterized protein [Spinacia oleracea]|uniref:Uncharacterized protein isoform X3 n=1 Tax=Spinacia oleracea TaxID=3562 RepID=A0ABM3R2Z2_SPIOL|nr:uncharacterized protein LOC110775454 isoform X3 [Spinacia oleracea]